MRIVLIAAVLLSLSASAEPKKAKKRKPEAPALSISFADGSEKKSLWVCVRDE